MRLRVKHPGIKHARLSIHRALCGACGHESCYAYCGQAHAPGCRDCAPRQNAAMSASQRGRPSPPSCSLPRRAEKARRGGNLWECMTPRSQLCLAFISQHAVAKGARQSYGSHGTCTDPTCAVQICMCTAQTGQSTISIAHQSITVSKVRVMYSACSGRSLSTSIPCASAAASAAFVAGAT